MSKVIAIAQSASPHEERLFMNIFSAGEYIHKGYSNPTYFLTEIQVFIILRIYSSE
jgi:hypothetical protein